MTLHRYDSSFGEGASVAHTAEHRPSRAEVGGWPARWTVCEAGSATVGYTHCRPAHDGPGPEMRSGSHTLTFPTRGVFRVHIGGPAGRVLTCDPNCVMFQNAGDVFRTSHPGAVGDETVWLSYPEEMVREAVRRHDPGVDSRPEMPFPFTVAPSDPGVFLMVHCLFKTVSAGEVMDRDVVERAALEVLSRSVAGAYERHRSFTGARRTTVQAHAEITENAKAFMVIHSADRLTIEDVAKHVHVSPFHLCRLFRRHAGLPIHRYLNRLRLRLALDRLHHKTSDLAGLAVELGFASHSHFCDAFKKEYGAAPSEMRRRVGDLAAILDAVAGS